jgi:AraC-like DNA-binding protein/ligand-binding sensor protein
MGQKHDISILENRLYREFRDAFKEATGLHLDLAAPGKFRIAEGAPHFCRLMDTTGATCQVCQDTHAAMQQAATENPHTTECFAGMTSTTIPVKLKGETVAFLSAGRVFLGEKNTGNFEKLHRFAKRHGFDLAAVERALQSTASSDPRRYRAAVNLVEIFARQFPDSIPGAPVAYPAIERVLQMLREDLEKDWTLAEAARAANMNATYFSDVFRRKTGSTFTQFLATLRVEKARALLESTSLRVSEIAFACGFRSISQFNRRFKEITGQSPSDLRSAKVTS